MDPKSALGGPKPIARTGRSNFENNRDPWVIDPLKWTVSKAVVSMSEISDVIV